MNALFVFLPLVAVVIAAYVSTRKPPILADDPDRPPDPDQDLLTAMLARHDYNCPGCHYNLRGIRGNICPECHCRVLLHIESEQFMQRFIMRIALVSALLWVMYFSLELVRAGISLYELKDSRRAPFIAFEPHIRTACICLVIVATSGAAAWRAWKHRNQSLPLDWVHPLVLMVLIPSGELILLALLWILAAVGVHI